MALINGILPNNVKEYFDRKQVVAPTISAGGTHDDTTADAHDEGETLNSADSGGRGCEGATVNLSPSPSTVPFLRCESEGSVFTFRGVASSSARQPSRSSSPPRPSPIIQKAQPIRNFQRVKLLGRVRLASVLNAHAAASAAELALTSYLQWQLSTCRLQ